MSTPSNIIGTTDFTVIEGRSASFYALLAGLAVLIAAGLWAAHHMDTEGHHITGMTNQIVWGIPHVFAVFLIVTASGALNAASLSSVMGRKIYGPVARLSGLLAIALLAGGLAIITLDLGRPDRLMVALTHFNMKSVFAWNVFFYSGFCAARRALSLDAHGTAHESLYKTGGAGAAHLAAHAHHRDRAHLWCAGRPRAYDVAIMAPMFIAMSLSFGTAAYLLLLLVTFGCTGRHLDDDIVDGLRRLLAVFVVVVLYFVAVFLGVKLYAAEYQGVGRFLLADGGIFTRLFWVVQTAAGSLAPLVLLLWRPPAMSRLWVGGASVLVLIGGFAQVYVIIIGGQAFPLEIFPGKQIIESSFYDGVVNHYHPSLPEWLLGLGGVAMALAMVVVAMRVLQFLPQTERKGG